MKELLRIAAAVTAVVMLLASCGKSKDDDNSSEIDITSDIITTTTVTTTAVESQAEDSEEESSQEEESEEGSEEESAEESEAEEESEEEPEESEAEESEPEPNENEGSGSVTVYKGLGYSFQTDDALWLNEQERLAQLQEEVAKQAEDMGLDAEVQDENGNSAFDAVYSYVPDSTQPYISNFNITAEYIGTNDVDLSGLKGQYESYYNSIEGFDVTSSEISSFKGRQSLKLTLTTTAGTLELKMLSYIFVNNNYLYSVNLASTTDRFDAVSADFDDIIDTFTFE